MSNQFTGRNIITTDLPEITRSNVLNLINDTKYLHDVNSNKINYLYNYYRGEQPIQQKTKETREEINNIVTENRAYEIVSFKKGYTFGEPVQYICRGDNANSVNDITLLNDYMVMCNKNKLDCDLAEWILICGVGYRLVLPNPLWSKDSDESPVSIYTLDPRSTYVVRYNDYKKQILAGVTFVKHDDNSYTYHVYTSTEYFRIENDSIVETRPLYLGYIPIIEYTSGNARLGSFEVVLPLLDAINNVQSLRIDDIQQHVDAILAIFGGDMDQDTYNKLKDWKTLVLPEGVDAKYLTAVLDQSGVQTLANALYQTVLTICGMPNRNGGSSTSDTGQAVILRDGWTSAETQAKNLESEFVVSEKNFLKVVLRIIRDLGGTTLKLIDIEVKFGRRYADNILTKVQALTQLLDCGIEPKIAIATCGIWNDPLDVAVQSKDYLDNRWGIDDSLDEDSDNTEDNLVMNNV